MWISLTVLFTLILAYAVFLWFIRYGM
jgi:hypothetical protein